MKNFSFVLLFFLVNCTAQVVFSDMEIHANSAVTDVFIDDYGNVYSYDKNFSFSVSDSLGNAKGKFSSPFFYKIQSVENPLFIVLFSEIKQEIKFLDENLNQIQTLNLSGLNGFFRTVYVEDLQYAWLLDEVNRQIIKYDFRNKLKINILEIKIPVVENVESFLVYENYAYYIADNQLFIFDLKNNSFSNLKIENPKKLRRTNDSIFVLTKNSVFQLFDNQELKLIKEIYGANVLDKNFNKIIALIGNEIFFYKF